LLAAAIRNSLILCGIHAFALFTVLTPFGLVSWQFQMVPLIAWMVLAPVSVFVPVYVALLLLMLLLPGGLGILLGVVSLLFLPASAVMAWQYRKHAEPFQTAAAGALTWIGVLIVLVVWMFTVQTDFVSALEQAMLGDPFLGSLMTTLFGSQEQVYQAIRLIIDAIPMAIMLFAVWQAVLSHWLARKILTRFWQPVPRMKPMKDWRLPRSLIWYYLIVLIVDMFFSFEAGSLPGVILLNALPLLTYAMAVQGIGFLFFLADAKGWSRALPITAAVICVLFSPLLPLAALVGVFDLAFPLRERLKTNR
jgi:uncharacterized protein YybS (DUF2232 family)